MQGILPVALPVILQNKRDKLHDRYLSGVAKHVHIFFIIALYEILQIFSASNTCVLVYFGFSFLNFQIVHLFSKIAFIICGAFSPGFKLLTLVWNGL